MFSGFNAFTPLSWLFFALAVAAFIVEVWALIDALRRPPGAFVAVGKQTKPLWLIILGVAVVIGLTVSPTASPLISILPIAAFVAAAIYLTDVRPKVRDSAAGHRTGPVRPW